MTSDTAKPEATPQAKPETFRSHLPAIIAATTGTVLAAVLGSLIGTAGTITGIVIGSLASGTFSWWAERGIRRSAALATAQAETIRARGHHPHPGVDAPAAHATAAVVTSADVGGPGQTERHRRWARPVAFIVAAFIGGALVVTLLEGAAGKPLSAVVQGKPGHGTTLGGGTVGKAAPATPSPAPSGSKSPTPSASTTRNATASATPSGASISPAASTAPAAATSAAAPRSTSPVSSTPNSVAPTATPTSAGG